ncbi:MAG: LuxR C-terminal-related transcriptional regulator [Rhodoglobus sp.]
MKDTPPADLIAALHKVARGEPIVSPAIMRKLILRFTEPSESRGPAAHLDKLTPQEQRVATAVARGLSNAAVASELAVSVATVKSHISSILGKLQVTNRVQLALLLHPASTEKRLEH